MTPDMTGVLDSLETTNFKGVAIVKKLLCVLSPSAERVEEANGKD